MSTLSQELVNSLFWKVTMKWPSNVSRYLRFVLLGIAGVSCISAIVLLVWIVCRPGIGYRVFQDKLSLIEEKTHSQIENARQRLPDESELPLSCRIISWTRSTFTWRKESLLRPKKYVAEYVIRGGQSSLRVSVYVVDDRVCLTVLTAPRTSEQLVGGGRLAYARRSRAFL